MRDFDGASFGREVVSSVKEYVAPVVSRLDAMEKSHEDAGRRAIDAETAVGKKIESLEAQVKEATEVIPGLITQAVAERPPAPVEISHVVEALGAFDLNTFFKDAIMLGAAGGGIDIVAPDDVSVEMTAAISMLSAPAPITKAIERGPGAVPLRPRTFRFERDDRGLITAAHEDYGS